MDIDVDKAAVQETEEYMSVLLHAGFSIQSVLERGFDYAHPRPYSSEYSMRNEPLLFAAKVVLQVAKNLHIDAESQGLYVHRSQTLKVRV